MKDKNGNELTVGDRVYVLPDKHGVAGGPGYVRSFSFSGKKARVDNGKLEDADLTKSQSYTWSSWCTADKLDRL